MMTSLVSVLALVCLAGPPSSSASSTSSGPALPAQWAQTWGSPTADLRPLQIVHGIRTNETALDAMASLHTRGLGGIVCNVAFKEYMTSEDHWQTLVRAMESCRQAGLVVWIYDEDGYPSGSAGGMVLKTNPAFEAQVLAYDASGSEPFSLRRAYEHTHASNNFYASRRYPNLIDDKAMRCFVEKTHQAYWERLQPFFGTTIRAFFTDEPSLMAVNLGQLGENVRKGVRVVDPVDPNVKALPTVPWSSDLPDLYRQRCGKDLLSVRESLFKGDSAADREVRRQFWALIADLVTDRYYTPIQTWCRGHRVAASGHNLWEEEILHHVPLYGNSLKTLMHMDIPGLDVLSSDPMMVVHGGWMTATLPTSAALLSGGRRVMTEVSDFVQRWGGKGPASLAEMQATAAWQAALGVTEFTSYYGSLGRIVTAVDTHDEAANGKKTRAYCDTIGRLNAVLRDARPTPTVLLYYPIYDLWAEYLPVAEPLKLESQSPRARQIVASFREMGRRLLTGQTSFILVDHELLASAEVKGSRLFVKGLGFDAIVLPAGVELPPAAAQAVDRFVAAGGKRVCDGQPSTSTDLQGLAGLQPSGQVQPACQTLVVGRFVRDGREILLLVNVGGKPYDGRLSLNGKPETWTLADPATGQVTAAKPAGAAEVSLALPANSAVLAIGPQPTR
jgi:hypothetical protein